MDGCTWNYLLGVCIPNPPTPGGSCTDASGNPGTYDDNENCVSFVSQAGTPCTDANGNTGYYEPDGTCLAGQLMPCDGPGCLGWVGTAPPEPAGSPCTDAAGNPGTWDGNGNCITYFQQEAGQPCSDSGTPGVWDGGGGCTPTSSASTSPLAGQPCLNYISGPGYYDASGNCISDGSASSGPQYSMTAGCVSDCPTATLGVTGTPCVDGGGEPGSYGASGLCVPASAGPLYSMTQGCVANCPGWPLTSASSGSSTSSADLNYVCDESGACGDAGVQATCSAYCNDGPNPIAVVEAEAASAPAVASSSTSSSQNLSCLYTCWNNPLAQVPPTLCSLACEAEVEAILWPHGRPAGVAGPPTTEAELLSYLDSSDWEANSLAGSLDWSESGNTKYQWATVPSAQADAVDHPGEECDEGTGNICLGGGGGGPVGPVQGGGDIGGASSTGGDQGNSGNTTQSSGDSGTQATNSGSSSARPQLTEDDLTPHAQDRMDEYGLTLSDLQRAVNNGKQFYDNDHPGNIDYVLNQRQESMLVAVNSAGNVTTVIVDDTPFSLQPPRYIPVLPGDAGGPGTLVP